MRFAIDLDGVLFERSNYPNLGRVNTEILWTLKELKAKGHKIHMFTARQGEALEIAQQTIKDLQFFRFDPYEFPCTGKIRADFYVDDRAIQPTALPRIVDSFLFGESIEDRWEKDNG